MRPIINKKLYTKTERIFAEGLKRLHIPFQHRVKIKNIEIDFLIGKHAVEIDGHKQDPYKNRELLELGYIPMHFQNNEIDSIKLWQEQIYSLQ